MFNAINEETMTTINSISVTYARRFGIYVDARPTQLFSGTGMYACDDFGNLIELTDEQLNLTNFFRFN